jgi:hypothetical protein
LVRDTTFAAGGRDRHGHGRLGDHGCPGRGAGPRAPTALPADSDRRVHPRVLRRDPVDLAPSGRRGAARSHGQWGHDRCPRRDRAAAGDRGRFSLAFPRSNLDRTDVHVERHVETGAGGRVGR